MSEHISIKVIRSKRKTMALQIDRSGNVLLRVPFYVGEDEIRRFVTGKRAWILKHLNELKNSVSGDEDGVRLTESEMRLLMVRAKRVIPQRAAHYAPIVGVTYGRITIRRQKSRWESCSSGGNLNFNCLLMLVPPKVLDYVVVHELCHRKEMNHSPKFWAVVEEVLPDYKKRRKWLRENGSVIIRRMTAGNPVS